MAGCRLSRYALPLIAVCLLSSSALARVIVTEGTNISVDVTASGDIVFDLLGGLWVLPDGSSRALKLETAVSGIRQPRYSPDGSRILFTANRGGMSQLYVYELATQATTALGDSNSVDTDAAWHPDAERIVFAASTPTGEDLWEMDLKTGLRWRLTDLEGSERDPAWSADGRDLVYIHERGDAWALMLRRHGEPDRALVESDRRLSSPSWRPDGSLVSYLKYEQDVHIHMLILSDPLLDRELVTDDDVFDAPIAWLDRQTLFYAANGSIRTRNFNSWIPRNVPFRAQLDRAAAEQPPTQTRRLPLIDAPDKRWILRVGRAYTNAGTAPAELVDIVIEAGRITAIEARKPRAQDLVVDMGDVTAVPGLIDAYAALPADVDDTLGPLLLSLGVTTLVVEHPRATELNRTWSGSTMPGPRLLPMWTASSANEEPADSATPWLIVAGNARGPAMAGRARRPAAPLLAQNWQTAFSTGANLVIGAETAPSSPAGRRYEDVKLATGRGPFLFVSALADADTEGLGDVLSLRQAALIPTRGAVRPGSIRLPPPAGRFIVGSKPNRLPAGLATHAEIRALAGAGLTGRDILLATGPRASRALGLAGQIGSLEAGALADIVLVDGDPARSPGSLSSVVGVVRNGRFFSAIGLIDRAR